MPSCYYKEYTENKSVPSKRKTLPITYSRHKELVCKASQLNIRVAQLYEAIVAIYFHHCYGITDFVLGTPVHNRRDYADKKMLGVFLSVIPGLLKISGEQTLGDLCKQISIHKRLNFKHQRFPLGEMRRDLLGSNNQSALYEIGFNYLKLDSHINIDGESGDLVYLSNNHEQTPIMFTIWEYGEQQTVEIQIDYNLAYFSASDIELLVERFD